MACRPTDSVDTTGTCTSNWIRLWGELSRSSCRPRVSNIFPGRFLKRTPVSEALRVAAARGDEAPEADKPIHKIPANKSFTWLKLAARTALGKDRGGKSDLPIVCGYESHCSH